MYHWTSTTICTLYTKQPLHALYTLQGKQATIKEEERGGSKSIGVAVSTHQDVPLRVAIRCGNHMVSTIVDSLRHDVYV